MSKKIKIKKLKKILADAWDNYDRASDVRREAWVFATNVSNSNGKDHWVKYVNAANKASDAWSAYVVACKDLEYAKEKKKDEH